MSLEWKTPEEPAPIPVGADASLEEAATRLRDILASLAARLRPFPAFLDMVSVQAVELEPTLWSTKDQGCVVVLPDGEICELELKVVPGIQGITDTDQLEEYRQLDLAAEDYIVFAAAAIRALAQELRRR